VLAAVLTYSAAPALYIQDQLLLLTMLPLPADDDDADADIMHHYPPFPLYFFCISRSCGRCLHFSTILHFITKALNKISKRMSLVKSVRRGSGGVLRFGKVKEKWRKLWRGVGEGVSIRIWVVRTEFH